MPAKAVIPESHPCDAGPRRVVAQRPLGHWFNDSFSMTGWALHLGGTLAVFPVIITLGPTPLHIAFTDTFQNFLSLTNGAYLLFFFLFHGVHLLEVPILSSLGH